MVRVEGTTTAVSPKPFVRITWWDAEDYQEAGWATIDTLDAFNAVACEVTSYGWLVSKSKLHVTIAADFIPPVTYGRMIKIPKKMIRSQEVVDFLPPPVVQSP